MKKIYNLVSAFIFITSFASAQQVTSLYVDPANPTTNDTIRVYIQCDFTYSPCEGFAQVDNISGSNINATAFHCVGALTTLCTDFDTLVIAPQPAGQYTLSVLLLQGDMMAGCVIGPNPPGFGAVNIDVTQTTSLAELSKNSNIIITPNPSDGNFSIKKTTATQAILKIFSIDGRLIQTEELLNTENEISCNLQPGVYIIAEECNGKTVYGRLVIEK